MFSFLRKLFNWGTARHEPVDDLAEWDDIDSWLFPPSDIHDRAAWDQYWANQVSHGLGPPLFDMFVLDDTLVHVMSEHGLTSVLCVGNGISQEPWHLAAAGLDVTALDTSPVALRIAETWPAESSPIANDADGVLASPERRPAFVLGDLLDPDICPGPFDVIVERRTLQLFSEAERAVAVDALLSRLQAEGIFLTHCHDAQTRPPEQPRHLVKPLLIARGIKIWSDPSAPKPRGQVGWVQISTG